MRTQETKTVKVDLRNYKTTRRKHNLKKNIKYHDGEEDFYKEYDEVDALDEFFSEPNYLEDFLD